MPQRHYTTAKIDIARLSSDRDETVNHIKRECGKLAQKEYKNMHNLLERVIHWELCKRVEFDDIEKWYMHKTEFIIENEMHKILKDHPTKSRKFNRVLIKKKTCHLQDFLVQADYRVKVIEGKKLDKYLGLAWELKKLSSMKVTVILIVIGALGTVPKNLE